MKNKMAKEKLFLIPLRVASSLFALLLTVAMVSSAIAAPVAGGTLDPLSIPKYVTPLVIPPVMNNTGTADDYDIAVSEFQQQILPGGIWNALNGRADAFPPTTVWSYGPKGDNVPAVAPDPTSQFNYPAYTIETASNVPVSVSWYNDLVADPDACDASLDPANDPACNYISHLLPVDQTLHWANPMMECRDGSIRTDCSGTSSSPYTGPVPIVTHVHGAHVNPHSDGYPEAWWLPNANNINPAWATRGSFFDEAPGGTNTPGLADYYYINDQPATTLWYHDHSLGMTRTNVYAGPAGFWLVRGGIYDGAIDGVTGLVATLPGPAPVAGQGVLALNDPINTVRQSIREIPIVIQDRSFNADGSLFYPADRAHFEGLNPAGDPAPTLDIPFIPDPNSDIAPIWNPEAFFNVMVVNGVSWPTLEVAPALYRFRLLNGCNSRFLNLSLEKLNKKGKATKDIPFYQIGAEQGFLNQVVEVRPGFATPLLGDGSIPIDRVRAPSKQQALLLALAERADVIVDFSGLKNGTIIQMNNTAPDAPFGGFPDIPADPATTGQVMQFVVNSALLQPTDALATPPQNLVLNIEPPLGPASIFREVSLNEGESESVCVTVQPDGSITHVAGVFPPACDATSLPFAPKEALLGTVGTGIDPITGLPAPIGIPLKWTDNSGTSLSTAVTMSDGSVKFVNVTENPTVGDTEAWDIYNFTADAHPIHLHLVRFEVLGRTLLDGITPSPNGSLQAWESGYKDTVISYPGEITTVKARFDLPGLYVWHCHIVEHEDNEMMRPYVVSM